MQKTIIHICGNPYKPIGDIPTTIEQLYEALMFIRQENLSLADVHIQETQVDLDRKGENYDRY